MKVLLIVLSINLVLTNSFAQGQEDENHQHTHVFNPIEEQLYYEQFEKGIMPFSQFPQTTWKECSDFITGNYIGFNCSNNRNISVILNSYMDNHFDRCINEGLSAQIGGKVDDLHVVHVGIKGDPNHSPRSLHAESRAIDIHSFKIRLTSGSLKTIKYSGTVYRTFFKAFRRCWGKAVHNYNGCPYYNGNSMYTGSIGWEDSNHQHHLHVSVPYCINGQYGPYYYRR